MDIVVIGFAGLSGSRRICSAEPYRSALLRRYSRRFLEGLFADAEGKEPSGMFRGPEASEASGTVKQDPDSVGVEAFLKENGIPEEHRKSCGEGGVFAALWELLHENRLGGAFCQRDIPIRQQTVELCEQYELNPYRLSGEDCILCLCDGGTKFVQNAAEQGLPAAVIGFTEKGPAIRRLDCEETAYLRRPEPDELFKLFAGEMEKQA